MTRDAARALADELTRRGLAAPARLLLEAHRPLAPLISSAATFLGPTVGALAGDGAMRLLNLVERPGGLDELVDGLNRADAERAEREAACRTRGS